LIWLDNGSDPLHSKLVQSGRIPVEAGPRDGAIMLRADMFVNIGRWHALIDKHGAIDRVSKSIFLMHYWLRACSRCCCNGLTKLAPDANMNINVRLRK
jgi:hypothetical protein